MRELFPQNNSTDIFGKDSDIVKKEDLLPVVQQLQNTIQQLNILADNLQQYKDDNESLITTEQLNAVNAAIQSLEATESNLTTAEVDNLTVNSLATLTNLVSQVATITGSLTVPSAVINNLTSLEVTGTQGNFSNLAATTADIEFWSVENLSTSNITATQKIGTYDLEVTNKAEIEEAEITNNLKVGQAQIEGDLSAENITSESVATDEVGTENIHWAGITHLSNVEEFYLEVPHFENGTYFIQLLQNTSPFATIEIYNSVDNYFVRWSQSDYNHITHIYKYETDQASKLYFKVENESGDALDVRYASTCATPNVEGPATYVELPIEDYQDYEIRYKDGSKFFKNVDMAQQGGTIGIFRALTSDDYSSATDDVSYDTTEDITAVIYKPDQSLNEADDVKFHEVDTTFLNVRDFSTRNFVATEMQTLSTIDLTQYDDGAIIVVRVGSTSASPQPSAAYIKQTENNVPVLYKLMVGKNLPTTGTNTNKPLIWSVADQAIVEATNIEITGTIDVGGDATFGGDVDITGDISGDNITLTGDATIGGDTTITGDVSADNATFTGDTSIGGDTDITGNATIGGTATITGTTTIHGDLYVDGTTHTTTEESLSTTGDTITLRQNNNTSLGANYSGFIVNKYDGIHDLALVTDSDGTIRVGTGTGTETTYTNIYWDDVSEKWYSDSALTTEVTPTGNLSSWGSLTIDGAVKHYTNAVFTQITYAAIIPLLARDEDSNLDNNSLLYWDGTTWKAKTIDAPTTNATLLQANIDPQTSAISYSWEDPIGPLENDISDLEDEIDRLDGRIDNLPRTFVFATMSDYTAAASTVPNGSIVVIQDEDDYLLGDNQ